jgi:hypothetical protein
MAEHDDEDLEVLRGCAAIAKAIKATERRTYLLLEKGILPAFRERGQWVSTRGNLKRHYSGGDAA